MTEQIDRDDCYFCGDEDDLERHHIFPRRYGGTDDGANLVDVCHDCHRKLEGLYDNRFYARAGLRTTDHAPVWMSSGEVFWSVEDPHTVDEDETLWCPGCKRRSLDQRRMWGPLLKNALQCWRCGTTVIGPSPDDRAHFFISELETSEGRYP